MCGNNRNWNYPLIFFALLMGVGAALLLYYVAEAVFPMLLWIGLGFAALMLIAVFAVVARPIAGVSPYAIRGLASGGMFTVVSILGTILTATVALSLQEFLTAETAAIPIIALVSLFGFFFGGLMGSVYFFLLYVFERIGSGNGCNGGNSNNGNNGIISGNGNTVICNPIPTVRR